MFLEASYTLKLCLNIHISYGTLCAWDILVRGVLGTKTEKDRGWRVDGQS